MQENTLEDGFQTNNLKIISRETSTPPAAHLIYGD